MDELGVLLAATRAEGRSLVSRVERGALYTLAFAVLALACAFTTVAFFGVAIYAASLADHGPAVAACFAGLAAALLMAVLLITMRWLMQPKSPPPPPEPRAAFPGMPNPAAFKQPKTVWDLVMLVAAGVLAGLAEKR